MPTSPSVPKYGLHRPSGQARVRINGRDIYLGLHGSPESHEAYKRVIAEHCAGGVVRSPRAERSGPTITQLVADFWQYRSAGRVSKRTLAAVEKPALRRLRSLYGSTRAAEFAPRSLRALQRSAIVDDGLSRQYVNSKLTAVVRRLFKWSVSEGLVPAEVYIRLTAAPAIQRGEFGARDTDPVRPINDAIVERTIAEMEPIPADMVRLQRLTGMRPGEVCAMRWADIDTTEDVWIYRPSQHKNAHRGKDRVIALGPKVQAVLMRYRDRPTKSAIFSPREAERQRKDRMRAARKTPVTPSQRARDEARSKRSAKRARQPGEAYTSDSYAAAIRRACGRLGIDAWAPNRLRHTAATQMRAEAGLDASWALLGHEKPDTTLIYAEQRLQSQIELARRFG